MEERVRIVGVLNTTPDSYFDGGQFITVQTAVDRARQMIEEGADIIEVGGESTGPGSADVSLQEERARTIEVIRALRAEFPRQAIGIDTWKEAIAHEAIEAGVSIVNDITAGRGDPHMFATLAQYEVPVVLMYSKDATPRTTVASVSYEDCVEDIKTFLSARKDAAVAAGIAEGRIILDPGMGHFVSSDAQYSYEILARLPEFAELGCPLFLSPSRKSFLAGSEKLKTEDRLPGTIAASAIAVLHGASYIRTHDVLEVRRGCEVASAMRRSRP